MTKTLQSLLSRADDIVAAKAEISQRREAIRAEKEQVFNDAGPEDKKAFAKVGELGAQENLLVVQMERLDRELAGLSAALLNEANHTRNAVRKAGQVKRAKMVAKIAAALEPFVPNPRRREGLIGDVSAVCPDLQLLDKRTAHIGHYDPNHETAVDHAKKVFRAAELAIAQCGL